MIYSVEEKSKSPHIQIERELDWKGASSGGRAATRAGQNSDSLAVKSDEAIVRRAVRIADQAISSDRKHPNNISFMLSPKKGI
jgi:hypothetical protein